MRGCLPAVMALALLAPGIHGAAAAQLVVIVATRSTVPYMRPDQVAAIFLGQSAQFPDGANAVAVDQAVGTSVRDTFYARVAAKSPARLKAYWSKLLFTGRGQPPREMADSTEVKLLVAKTPGMIGYIDSSALDATVRAVLVVR